MNWMFNIELLGKRKRERVLGCSERGHAEVWCDGEECQGSGEMEADMTPRGNISKKKNHVN